MSDLHDVIRAAIDTALADSDEFVSEWVFAYETSGIDSDGDLGGYTGLVKTGSTSSSIGLCYIAARSLEEMAVESD